MKSVRKIICLLLSFSLCFSLFGCSDKNEYDGKSLPESEFIRTDSDEDYVFDVYEDYTVITEYKGEDFRVTIPSRLGGKPVKGIGDNAIGMSMLAVDIVDIPKNVVYISPSAFSECTTSTVYSVNELNPVYKSEDGVIYSKDGKSLLFYPSGRVEESIKVAENVEIIGEYAFANNEDVTNITLPSGITEIGNYSFWGCDKLNKINLPENITKIGDYAFFECQQLAGLVLPEKLLSIGAHAFDYCVSVQELKIPDTVVSIGDSAFNSCLSLSSITLPASLEKYGYSVFTGCHNLKEFNLSQPNNFFRVSGGVLYSYDGEELVDYPYGKTDKIVEISQNVKSIRPYAFYRTESDLKNEENDYIVDIRFSNVEKIGAYAFSNRSAIKAVGLPSTLKEISSTSFYNCKNLTEYRLNNCDSYFSDNGVLYTGDKKTIVAYPEGNTSSSYTVLDGTENIAPYAFSLADNLTEINLPKSIKTVGDYAFYRTGFVTELIFSESLEKIGEGSFANTISLENLVIPDNTITEIPYKALSSADGLFEFEIPSGVTKIGDEAFMLSAYIYSIVIPDTVTEIGDRAFFDMDNLHEIVVPQSVKTLGDSFIDKYDNNLIAKVYEGSFAESFVTENEYPYEIIK